MPGEAGREPYLTIRKVTKRFGAFTALSDVDLDVYEGELVSFLGPSGCGKTTLLRCISGLDVQSEGTIVQAGRDISALPVSARDFGIVFQSYALFPNLTIRDNVAYGRRRRAGAGPRPTRGYGSCSSWSACQNRRPSSRLNSREASNSGSPSRGRWPCRPAFCCSMSRSPPWTRASGPVSAARSATCSGGWESRPSWSPTIRRKLSPCPTASS